MQTTTRDYVTPRAAGGLRLVVDAPPLGPWWAIQAGGRRGTVMHATAHTPAARIALTGMMLGALDGAEGAQVAVITYRGDAIVAARTRVMVGGRWQEARAVGDEVCDG